MLLRNISIAVILALGATASIAQAPATPEKPAEKPQVQVNYLNVCSPSAEDQQQLAAVLKRISPRPVFGLDMEISRGRSTLNPSDLVVNTGQPAATAQTSAFSNWVRIRRDFPDSAAITSAQYSFSVTENHVSETLVFHFKDAKDILQLALNDSVDSASDPGEVARLKTPADRIRVERFGKASIVLARCPTGDQTAYEPLFRSATDLLNTYRAAMKVPTTVPSELSRLGTKAPAKAAAAPAKPQ